MKICRGHNDVGSGNNLLPLNQGHARGIKVNGRGILRGSRDPGEGTPQSGDRLFGDGKTRRKGGADQPAGQQEGQQQGSFHDGCSLEEEKMETVIPTAKDHSSVPQTTVYVIKQLSNAVNCI